MNDDDFEGIVPFSVPLSVPTLPSNHQDYILKVISTLRDCLFVPLLINHPVPEIPPKGRFDTTPDPFICLQFHYTFDRYTCKTIGYAIFYNPNSGLQYAVDFSE